MTRVAVLGHTEWVDFIRVAHQPGPGDLVEGTRLFAHAGGGAVVAAAVLASLGAEVHLYTALCEDEHGHRAAEQLRDWGVVVHAAPRPGASRLAFTTLVDGGERTIVTVGERHAPQAADPFDLGPLREADGVYATAADPALLAIAAGTGACVVTTRIGPPASFASGARVAAAVYSASDEGETAALDGWSAIAELMVATEGSGGGSWHEGDERPPERGRWDPAEVPGRPRDSYGCGDSFAAGVTFGLARREGIAAAARIGAECGARMLTRVGAP